MVRNEHSYQKFRESELNQWNDTPKKNDTCTKKGERRREREEREKKTHFPPPAR
jgi:hypothetical protein